jgi:dimethylhistidine N-methyltransferase
MESGILIDAEKTLFEEIITGLSAENKYLPSKLFYDEKGSKLFDEICELDEYYPTRTELKIMKDNIKEITSFLDKETLFIEFGSGSSLKTKLILDNVDNLAGYIPIDISETHLKESANKISERYPNLDVYPLAADYTQSLEFPAIKNNVKKKVAYFPGSTIGNFTPNEAIKFFEIVADEIGKNGGLLIGVDMIKEKSILELAYDDSKGVTSEFNLNILSHINNKLNSNFELKNFSHLSFYNSSKNRIEMHLKSTIDQVIKIGEHSIEFKEDETILTEYSHKYSLESFEQLCSNSFQIRKVWMDLNSYFSVQYLSVI